jgi:hypothetical protein
MARKAPKNSVEAAVKAAQYEVPAPPDGYTLADAEAVVWEQMISVREDWRNFDLILMVKIVRLEVKIRDWWDMLDKSGPMIRNPRGTLIENPILRSIDTLQRQQLSVITKMQLMTLADPRTLNKEAQKQDLNELKDGNVLRLLARP